MSEPTLVPPLKCQGIKTKLVPYIEHLSQQSSYKRWVEPFCGSCVTAFNIQPKCALLSDVNPHIVALYSDIQNGRLSEGVVRSFLEEEGALLELKGQEHFYEVRKRFNNDPSSLDFLFLNRSCFNGVMRFNRARHFNVPFGHKIHRFSKAYITKICNQVRRIGLVAGNNDWVFTTADFRSTLAQAHDSDLIYCDPPYAGRHADYYNQWSDKEERDLHALLQFGSFDFILSTWHSNRYRTNTEVQRSWTREGISTVLLKHFYHVGSSEDYRGEMTEALITNIHNKSRSDLAVTGVESEQRVFNFSQ